MARQSNGSHPALSYLDDIAARWSDFLLLVGRVLLGWLFLTSGWAKLGNIAGTAGYFQGLGLVPPEAWAYFGSIGEFVLGAALILGVATRYAALGYFIWVVVATAIAHRYWTYTGPAQGGQYVHFLKNLAIMGGALYVFVFGAGGYSVDAKLAKR